MDAMKRMRQQNKWIKQIKKHVPDNLLAKVQLEDIEIRMKADLRDNKDK